MRGKLLESGVGIVVLVAVSVAGRLLPHAPNFTPLAATVLFAGFFFRRAGAAISVPIAAMLASDAIIGFYDWRLMAVVYGSLLAPIGLRRFLGDRASAGRVGLCSVASSVTFFLTTNFGVWMFGGFYPHTLAGIIQCYAAGLAFFQYTLAGDLFWSAFLFGGHALATSLATSSLRKIAGTPVLVATCCPCDS